MARKATKKLSETVDRGNTPPPVPASNHIPVACFAQPLTEDKLSEYEDILNSLEHSPIKDAMRACLECVKAWWEIPVSENDATIPLNILHKGKTVSYNVVPLEKEQVDKLDETTPWMHELLSYKDLFLSLPHGTIETQKVIDGSVRSVCEVVDQKAHNLKNAATHLLWYAIEICHDREPLTNEVLNK